MHARSLKAAMRTTVRDSRALVRGNHGDRIASVYSAQAVYSNDLLGFILRISSIHSEVQILVIVRLNHIRISVTSKRYPHLLFSVLSSLVLFRFQFA